MASLSKFGRWVSRALGARQPWPLKTFANPRFDTITARVEEETLPDYLAARYYPVRIGELFVSRYQVVGKLGYGMTSTVWLARDLAECRHVALKIFIRSSSLGNDPSLEINAHRRLKQGPRFHSGRQAVRDLLDSFTVSGPDGEHMCLVHSPLWDDMKTFLARNPIGRLPKPVLAIVLKQVLSALDYARQCQIIHTDIKASNIMFGIENSCVLDKFEQAELEYPTPRKEVDGRAIYMSRLIEKPDLAPPVLCDFGSAQWGEEIHKSDVQPDIYRSPEVILGIPWSYEIDVWNVGCMIWDLFEGRHLFYGVDPEHGVYRGRAHLAEMIALLGPPPPDLVARGSLSSKFFSDEGQFQAGIQVPPEVSFDQLVTEIEGAEKDLFINFVSKMLQWDPQKRQTPKQLLEDEWLKENTRY